MITPILTDKIRQIVRYFETSKTTGADYGAIAVLKDGPANIPQLTYGSTQTAEFSGNLKGLIKLYMYNKGAYRKDFGPFVEDIGNPHHPSLSKSPKFINLLRLASEDIVMHQTQDEFFHKYYFYPALSCCDRFGLVLPLSQLVIYDTYVHSGSVMNFLRRAFPERIPIDGGNEKEWVGAYVNVRDKWLENNVSKPILQSTDYRTDSFIYAIKENNWMLDKPFKVVNYADKDELGVPRMLATIA